MLEEGNIFDLINSELNIGFLEKKIGDARYKYERYVPVEITNEYDNYTILDYLVLYKINRMFQLGKISESQRDLLINLFNLKMELEKKYNDCLLGGEADLILDQILLIEEKLAKFDLIPAPTNDEVEFKIEDIIDRLIVASDCKNVPNNSELEATIKRVREKK